MNKKRFNESSDDQGPEYKKQKLACDLFRKVVTREIVNEITLLTKNNNGFFNTDTTLFNDMLVFIKEKLKYLYNSDKDTIKFVNWLHFTKGKITISKEDINKYDTIFIIVFVISANQNKQLSINLTRWFRLKNLICNNSHLDLNTNSIQTEDLFVPIKKEEEGGRGEMVIDVKPTEQVTNKKKKIPMVMGEIYELESALTIGEINSLLQDYLLLFSKVMLSKMNSTSKYPVINKKDINLGRVLFLRFVLLNNPVKDIIDPESSNSLNTEIGHILRRPSKSTVFDLYNIKFPLLTNWLDFEERIYEIKISNYTHDLVNSIRVLLIEINKRIEYKKAFIGDNSVSRFIESTAIKSLTILNYKGFDVIKIDFKYLIYILNFHNKHDFSTKNLLPLSSKDKNGWKGVLDNGFVYLNLENFLYNVLPKIQRWFSYVDFLIRFISFYDLPIDKRFELIYTNTMKKSFFAYNSIYTNNHILNFMYILGCGDKIYNNKTKTTKTNVQSVKHVEVTDIEELISNGLPPCIRYAAQPKKHLKNQDRRTLGIQYTNIGLDWTIVEQIHKDNTRDSVADLKSQYTYQKNKPRSLTCYGIFDIPHQQFGCPYEIEYREERKNQQQQQYDFNEKEDILSKCRKCNGTNHNTPAEFILNKLQLS